MTRVQCIGLMKDGAAMSALDEAINDIREHQAQWGRSNEPEEDVFTREILGALIELQVRSVQRAVQLGATMAIRLSHEEREAA